MRTFLSALTVLSLSLFFLPANSAAYEIGTDFEGAIPGFGLNGWGIREVTTCQYGPQVATSGTKCVGVPEDCSPGYPNNTWEGFFTTPHIALGDSFPALYIRYNYWADIEGVTDTFDGCILEFINLTQGTTVQIDSLAELQLTPTYDDQIVGTGPFGGLWAYCYDTLSGLYNPMGFPYVSFSYMDPSGNTDGGKLPRYTHAPQDFTWKAVQSVDLIGAGYAAQGDTIQIQWHFASDQLANGQGYFIDDLYISNNQPVDVIPPIINVTSPNDFADIATENVPVPVEATIIDLTSGVLMDSVFLVYTLDESTVETRVLMTNTGGDNFTADVEGLPFDTDVYFRVVAYDTLFNRGITPMSTFEVTNAVTLFYDNGVPYWVNPVPEIGSGFSNRFNVPADTLYQLHKVMFYFAKEDGLFDVVLTTGTVPSGPEMARFEDITNGALGSTFFQFEFPESLAVQGPSTFWAGMRHVSADTLLDPQLLTDETKEYTGVSFSFFTGNWTENPNGEAMIRVKVKKTGFTGIGGDETAGGTLPKVFAMSQNYPNPFNPQTVISYDIPETAGSAVGVTIDIYNIHGQRVRALVSEEKEPGSYKAQWDGRNERGIAVSSGIYFYRIKAGDYQSTRKMVLLK